MVQMPTGTGKTVLLVQEIKNEELRMKNESDEIVNSKSSNRKFFDLSGRPATGKSRIVIKNNKKILTQ